MPTVSESAGSIPKQSSRRAGAMSERALSVPIPAPGFTVADVAARYRVSPDKVRGWIAKGVLRAINTATVLCARPRWVVPPEALAEFERGRQGGPLPKPVRRKRLPPKDYYPD
jgi:hypothetical protein